MSVLFKYIYSFFTGHFYWPLKEVVNVKKTVNVHFL